MENFNINPERTPNPRRRKRSPRRVFMESYLPVIIFVLIAALIVVFIVTASNNKKRKEEEALKASLAARESSIAQMEAFRKEAAELYVQAKYLYDTYQFLDAINLLDTFSGDIYDFNDLLALRDSCTDAMENTVEYTPDQVLNLSFQLLIEDPVRAFKDPDYAGGYKKNFITTAEFRNILEDLHANGYVLVDLDDLFQITNDGNGNTAFTPKTLSLPQGRKPIMLTETQVNYYTYMIDPDKDGVPDSKGAGFASKLILDEKGEFTCEMVDATGETVTGSFDLVPILEEFIKEHPDFSYNGARAILAVTGYDGVFGYRRNKLEEALPILDALKERGYEIAFYSYANTDYEASTVAQIAKDVESWKKNIEAVIGETPILVFARNTDIAGKGEYTGEKFAKLQEMGFRYYLGYLPDGNPWCLTEPNYIRQGRLVVSAINIQTHPEWYTGLFDPATVLEASR